MKRHKGKMWKGSEQGTFVSPELDAPSAQPADALSSLEALQISLLWVSMEAFIKSPWLVMNLISNLLYPPCGMKGLAEMLQTSNHGLVFLRGSPHAEAMQEPTKNHLVRKKSCPYHPGNFEGLRSLVSGPKVKDQLLEQKMLATSFIAQEAIRVLRALCQEQRAGNNYRFLIISQRLCWEILFMKFLSYLPLLVG